MNKPSISFIIPYYKVELPLLARAITSILRLGQKADWEVWVINDGTDTKRKTTSVHWTTRVYTTMSSLT